MSAPIDRRAALVVVVCSMLWGLWWLPVGRLQGVGIDGAWIGVIMTAAVLPVAMVMFVLSKGSLSPRAILGSLIAGAAVTLYSISVGYTDFIRAVLLFYFAPAWSTIIECLFMGRRWSLQSALSILLSVGGIALISRGDISLDGLGAVGDWMALASGLLWSIGIALLFSSARVDVSRMLVITAGGGIICAVSVALADGVLVSGLSTAMTAITLAPEVFAFTAVYMGVLLAGTMWGAFRLPPVLMTYLLSVEILTGVLSSAFILGETFGLIEFGGAALILGAVLVEILWTRLRPARPENTHQMPEAGRDKTGV